MPLRRLIQSGWKRLKRRDQKSSKSTTTTGTDPMPTKKGPETRKRHTVVKEQPRATAKGGSQHIEPDHTSQTLISSAPSTHLADELNRRIDFENCRSHNRKSDIGIDKAEAASSQRDHVQTTQSNYESADQPSLRSEKEEPKPLPAIDAKGAAEHDFGQGATTRTAEMVPFASNIVEQPTPAASLPPIVEGSKPSFRSEREEPNLLPTIDAKEITELDFGHGATTRTAEMVPFASNIVEQPTPAASLPPVAQGSVDPAGSTNPFVLPYPHKLQSVQTLRDSVYSSEGDSTDVESVDEKKIHGGSQVRLPGITVRSATFHPEPEQHRYDASRLSATSIRPLLGLSPSLAHVDAKNKLLPRSPAASITTTDMANDIFPHKVICILKLGFNGHMLGEEDLEDEFLIEWTQIKPYKDLLRKVDTRIKKLEGTHADFRDHRTYMRCGTCQVKGTYHEQQVSILKDKTTLHDIAIKDICGFISQHNYESFHLEVFLGYSSVKIAATESTNQTLLAEIIRDEVHRKQLENFKSPHQWYVPRIDVHELSRKDIIERVIHEDHTLDLEMVDKAGFASQVVQTAAKLFLVCIMQDHPMEYLRHLMDYHRFEDLHLPKECGCAKPGCPQRLRRIVQIQDGLFAHHFESDQNFKRLGANVILPIQYANENDKEKSFLGKGNAAAVYAVRIDPVHHNMSGDLDAQFALKIFHNRQVERFPFKRELKMMKILARYPNPNIVPFLTSWVQDGFFHILYPRASCSLYDYLGANGTNPPKPTLRNAKWLLEQFRGLADAVRYIHELGGPEDPPPRDVAPWMFRATKRDPRPDVNTIGCHYDINPRNVLVFERKPGKDPMFKLNDFGSGKFQTLGEGQESVPERGARGHITYMAPEVYIDGASRPFDIWGLGCVYLELMGWFLMCTIPDQGEKFAEARLEHRLRTVGDEFDYFWTKKGEQYVLNDAVDNRIKLLEREHCIDLPGFKGVLVIIRRMFEIEPKIRPKAATIYRDMDGAVIKMEESYSLSQHGEQELSDASECTTEKPLVSDNKSTATNSGGGNETTVADEKGTQDDHHQSAGDIGPFQYLEKSTTTTGQEDDTIDPHDDNESAPRAELQHEFNQITRTLSDLSIPET